MTGGSGSAHSRVARLVQRIAAQIAELDMLSEESSESVVAGPASELAIEMFERRIDFVLPDDYRAFLLLHNGWRGFDGEQSLLSLEEMLDGPLHESIRLLQDELALAGEHNHARGLVFEGSYAAKMSCFCRQDDRVEVVTWDHGNVHSFRSFTQYLEDYTSLLGDLIEEERANLR